MRVETQFGLINCNVWFLGTAYDAVDEGKIVGADWFRELRSITHPITHSVTPKRLNFAISNA